jgi:hypothetical protein
MVPVTIFKQGFCIFDSDYTVHTGTYCVVHFSTLGPLCTLFPWRLCTVKNSTVGSFYCSLRQSYLRKIRNFLKLLSDCANIFHFTSASLYKFFFHQSVPSSFLGKGFTQTPPAPPPPRPPTGLFPCSAINFPFFWEAH